MKNGDILKNIATNIQRQIDQSSLIEFNLGQNTFILEKINDLISTVDQSYKNRIANEFFHEGPLIPLIENDEITEIIIQGSGNIIYEENGVLNTHEDYFLTPITFTNFVHRMAQEANMSFSLDQPYADGFWRGFRVHILTAPITTHTYHISLRRHPECPWTLEKLLKQDWCTMEQMQMIQNFISQKKNILIVGPTSSGKTSVLSACLQELKPTERALILEDSSELKVPNTMSTKLLTRVECQSGLCPIHLDHLLKQALRMRPDRLIIGEIRSTEAKDLLMALSTGHVGSMGTLHASSAKQALTRLEMLVQLGAPHWNVSAIRSLLYMSLQAILVVHKNSKGHRVFDGLYQICSLEESGFLIEKVC